MEKPFTQYRCSLKEGVNLMSQENWCMDRTVAMFQFGSITLQLELEATIYGSCELRPQLGQICPISLRPALYIQRAFVQDVKSLRVVMEDLVIAVLTSSHKTTDCADPSIINNMKRLNNDTCIIERLVSQTQCIADPVKRISLFMSTFNLRGQKDSWRILCSLFYRLYFVPHIRDGDLDQFTENMGFRPALSQMGKMRIEKK
ncbi:hypothetical protein CHS0354_007755 [Potamilus streckersoni]|uniref:Uncharacterized protein n=1 Tax=Potamilus streckersoni TaxID=2493646 RepID=A0AAE0VHX1_9BIVA|nr:hypothetical protein CHS0354_007755 [Potamilus streckersoni]